MKPITPIAWVEEIRGDAGFAGRPAHKSAHTGTLPPGHSRPGAKPPDRGSTI